MADLRETIEVVAARLDKSVHLMAATPASPKNVAESMSNAEYAKIIF